MLISVNKQGIAVTGAGILVSNSIGQYTASVSFSPEWANYDKVVVFKNGDTVKEIAVDGQDIVVPWEVLENEGVLEIGAYGLEGANKRPTVWGKPLAILKGVEEGETAHEPTILPWEELVRRIGQLSQLETESHESLVAAVNEVLSTVPAFLSELTPDSEHMTVSQEEKTEWSGKADPEDIPEITATAINNALGYTAADNADVQENAQEISQINESITEISDDINHIKNFEVVYNLKDFEFVDRIDLDGSGNAVPSTTYSTTDFFDRCYAENLEVTLASNTTLYVYLYDADKNYIENYKIQSSVTYDVGKASCKYVRFNTKIANLENKVRLQKVFYLKREESGSVDLFLNPFMDMGNIDSNGEYFANTDNRCTPKFLKVNGGEIVEASIDGSGDTYIFQYDENKNFVQRNLISNYPLFLFERTRYLKFATSASTTINLTINGMGAVTWAYNKSKGYGTQQFYFDVHYNHGTDSDSVNTSVNTSPCYTGGLLRLPPNYTDEGDKVPVIYFAHGSADYYRRNGVEFSANYMPYIQYLQDEGYAIFDANGNSSNYNASYGCQWPTPTDMSCIKQALNWVCKNYNVDRDRLYVMSKSLGGLQASQMCFELDTHVKACCPLAPEFDITVAALGYYKGERERCFIDLGFEGYTEELLNEDNPQKDHALRFMSNDMKQLFRDNAHKLNGYNPAWRGLIGLNPTEMIEYELDGDPTKSQAEMNAEIKAKEKVYGEKLGTMTRICTVPVKVFIAPDDTAVSYDMAKGFVQSIKNGGGVAELRTLPIGTGGHHAVDNATNALKVSSIKTHCGAIHTDVPLAYVEAVQFFKRYS